MSDLSIGLEGPDGRSIEGTSTNFDELQDDAHAMVDLCIAGSHAPELRTIDREALADCIDAALDKLEHDSFAELAGVREYRALVSDDYTLTLVRWA